MTDFAYEHDIEVRFRDLDPLGHVNHAVYASYCEQARIRYLREVLGLTADDLPMVVANLELNYRKPVTFDDDLTAAVAVTSLGESSFTMTYELRAADVVATAETTQVVVDRETKRPTAVPTEWRERLREYEPSLE
ncbi:thioesterase family protein [Haloprofundus sp. MHR1]|uniref:acyl-CoA thioesterase n=2 Tax=Haloprofundus TaxID=1911573 RepID=UPI000E43C0BF|nr:thioesterase family protein [Haloprofundus sp. MHR1]QCJ45635.1 acyl-CoA thioesterase [Haloprofundus sp. MHR1]